MTDGDDGATPSYDEDRIASPEMRYAHQLSYSMRILGEIGSRYQAAQDSDDLLPAMAMLDAFYVHLRLVAEFLTRPTNHKDFGPIHLGVDEWVTPETDAATRLADYWDRASKYVVHFGHSRVPESIAELETFEVSAAALRRMAADAFEVLEELVSSVEAAVDDGPVLTVPQLRAQLLRRELDQSVTLLAESGHLPRRD
jgi:hypothetical protein